MVSAAIKVVPDPKSQFKVTFTPIDTINDPVVLRALQARRVEAGRAASIPYDEGYLQGETADKDSNASPPSSRTKKFARK